jgi:hypothetical protein
LYTLAKDIGEADDLAKRDPKRVAQLHAMPKRCLSIQSQAPCSS